MSALGFTPQACECLHLIQLHFFSTLGFSNLSLLFFLNVVSFLDSVLFIYGLIHLLHL